MSIDLVSPARLEKWVSRAKRKMEGKMRCSRKLMKESFDRALLEVVIDFKSFEIVHYFWSILFLNWHFWRITSKILRYMNKKILWRLQK
jgi:hypothetical protein